MSSNPAIAINGLSKCFHIYNQPQDRLLQMLRGRSKTYYREFWALNDINFEVMPGETVGIVGQNGSGKSTLLQIICGTLSPTLGEVKTSGRIAALLELGAGFNPEFTGRQNAILNAQILGLEIDEINERMPEIESFANVGEFFDRPVKTYSSGMYVRVAFAVQACVTPDILIVDEALAVGDEKFQRKCYDRFEELRDQGTSILFVTHSTTAIERFCQRAVLLHKGNVHGVGPSNQIVDQYHALLYSDEKSYLKHMNSLTQSNQEDNYTKRNNHIDEDNDYTATSKALANITDVCLTNEEEVICDVFAPEDIVKLKSSFHANADISELQVGLSIKTVEGVHAYGTSTLYKDKNILDIKKGQTITTEFKFGLNLAPGTYFISIAIAKPVSRTSMTYVDKRSDVLILKVADHRAQSTGIAYMSAEISESRKNG